MSAKKIRWKQVKHHWEIYLFIVPALVLIVLFQYYPAASGIFHSFYRWNGADISEFIGLKNYTELLKSPDFWQSFRVALLLGLWNVVKMIPAIAVAVWIHRCSSERMQYLYRLLFVVPMVVPALVIALIWRSFFFEATQGYLNQFLDASGLFPLLCNLDAFFGWGGIFLEGTRPAWLGDPRLILVSCVVWGFPWVGSFAVLTHLAKLQNIPKEIYEAASIDGATWWTKFTRIEIPLIMSSIYLMLVFVIIGTIKDAGMIIALTGGMDGGPGGTGDSSRPFHAPQGIYQPGDGRRLRRWNCPDCGNHGIAETQLSRAGRKSERHMDQEGASAGSDRGERLASLSTWLARYRRLPSYDGLPVRCSARSSAQQVFER